MKTVGDKLEAFTVTAAKPGFNNHEENGVSAFEEITGAVVPRQVENHLLLPEGFHLRVPDGNRRVRQARPKTSRTVTPSCSAVSVDNEFVKLAWRREHKDLSKLGHYSFGDAKGELIDQLGVRDKGSGRRPARHVHRRSGQYDPARFGEQPERRPQS